MNLTDRDVHLLDLLLALGFMVTQQLRAALFPADKDGSVTRERLRKLEAAGLLQRRRAEVANPFVTSTMPVWIITQQGMYEGLVPRSAGSKLCLILPLQSGNRKEIPWRGHQVRQPAESLALSSAILE
jgi:protein involved in plasmid replication-relaxation